MNELTNLPGLCCNLLQLPSYLGWANAISYFGFATQAIIQSELSGLELVDESGEVVQVGGRR